jgi:hypothetical protein
VKLKTNNDRFVVTRAQIEKAIERNRPFVLKMAGGNEYNVPHRDSMTGLHQSGDGYT